MVHEDMLHNGSFTCYMGKILVWNQVELLYYYYQKNDYQCDFNLVRYRYLPDLDYFSSEFLVLSSEFQRSKYSVKLINEPESDTKHYVETVS